jgi:hypothetical protein
VTTAFRAGRLGAGLALTIAVSGCGSSASTASRAPATTPTTPTTGAASHVNVPTPRLSIPSPRPTAHTGSTLTVRVTVSGAPATGADRFRYVLDRRLTRSGPSQLTFHDLAPGRHHMEVVLASGGAARATTAFTVRAAPPVAVEAPAQVPETTTSAPPATPSPAPSTGGIPQGNGGDEDRDNNGGPSDGDGNI